MQRISAIQATETGKPGYMERIKLLKARVLETKPEMDLENACLLTRGFQDNEGKDRKSVV